LTAPIVASAFGGGGAVGKGTKKMHKTTILTDKGIILALYNSNPDVVYAAPEGQHIAHIVWHRWVQNSDRKAGIDYFLVDKPDRSGNGESSSVIRARVLPQMEQVENAHVIEYRIADSARGLEDTIRAAACTDIWEHLGRQTNLEAKALPMITYSETIETLAKIHNSKHAEFSFSGKQDFYPECIFDLNLDLSLWCQSGITTDGKLAPWESCEYCYAAYSHENYPAIYSVDRKTLGEKIRVERAKRAAEGKPTRYLRLGKKMDCGSDIFEEALLATFEACIDENIKPILPTKYLRFSEQMAKALERADATLLISLGHDSIEPGAVTHGSTQEWRLEQGQLYLRAGVRAVPYMLADPTREDCGPFFADMYRQAKNFPRVQILPLRFMKRTLADKILGSWANAIGPRKSDLFGKTVGGFEQQLTRNLLHNMVHPTLEAEIGDNDGRIRMCSHNSNDIWCGKCFMPEERGVIKPHEKVVIDYTNKPPRKKNGKAVAAQTDLDASFLPVPIAKE
jgi:hypothetical protein